MNRTKKPVLFVSLGPGDPELITLKGLNALRQADVILTPSTLNREDRVLSRSRNILLALGVDEEKISLFAVPMSKDRAKALLCYSQAATRAAEDYNKGLSVAITAEGDSGFYSSSQYINEALADKGIPTKRIEGIPAFISCGALANIHIAKQEEQLIIVPGKTSQKELDEYIIHGKSIVIDQN